METLCFERRKSYLRQLFGVVLWKHQAPNVMAMVWQKGSASKQTNFGHVIS